MQPEDPSTHAPDSDAASIKVLLDELRTETSSLLQKEAELARAELTENAARLGKHVKRFGVGSFVAYAGLLVLLFGLGNLVSALLIRYAKVDPLAASWIGPIGVGLITAFIGWAVLASGRKAVRTDTLMPEQTLQSLHENKAWMQTKLQPSHEPV
jgi:hypothetical protein